MSSDRLPAVGQRRPPCAVRRQDPRSRPRPPRRPRARPPRRAPDPPGRPVRQRPRGVARGRADDLVTYEFVRRRGACGGRGAGAMTPTTKACSAEAIARSGTHHSSGRPARRVAGWRLGRADGQRRTGPGRPPQRLGRRDLHRDPHRDPYRAVARGPGRRTRARSGRQARGPRALRCVGHSGQVALISRPPGSAVTARAACKGGAACDDLPAGHRPGSHRDVTAGRW